MNPSLALEPPSSSSTSGDASFHDSDDSNLETTTSLEELQSTEQRRVLDIISQLRKCGLESILSLPQLVVCGDQSAGKSSVLEALTEIPFPRNDNLCTRFATEIILRRATTDSLIIKVIPDTERPADEQDKIRLFKECISDFQDLPRVMDLATEIMGIDKRQLAQSRAFAKDVLSIEIEGPSRPQLTLVDLPGLIQTQTKGVTKEDVSLVAEITEHYISQPRTVCLAVVSATNDYANQGILTRVRSFDPKGQRTLGIITKPDRLSPGSGMEKAFFDLASNEDIFFNLGWHVLKNRTYEEGSNSFYERNASEVKYFNKSVFKSLPKDCVGIDALRFRLSGLLFTHVKQELPKLREDLDEALGDTSRQLLALGNRRATSKECRNYLMGLALQYYELCKGAIGGHYEGPFFTNNTEPEPGSNLPTTVRRLRAIVQYLNSGFADTLRTKGHKYQISNKGEIDETEDVGGLGLPVLGQKKQGLSPAPMSGPQAVQWVKQILLRTRGRELPGNFNPLLVGELFWEQSANWRQFAEDHIEKVARATTQFLSTLLNEKCPNDVYSRLWTSQIQESLKTRKQAAYQELNSLNADIKNYPINYNHYYTDTIHKRRLARGTSSLEQCIKNSTTKTKLPDCQSNHLSTNVDVSKAVQAYANRINPDMEKHSCEEALDCLFSLYKVSQKTYIANVTTQVIERHMVRGLEDIFSPVVVNNMTDVEVEAIASEPTSAKRQREFLDDRQRKLEDGFQILKDIMSSAAF